MKKRFLFAILIFIFFMAAGFSETVHWFTPGKPELEFSVSPCISFKRDLRNDVMFIESYASADFKELFLDSGLSLQSEKFDFTTRAHYMPLFLDIFRAGIGVDYHFYRYFGVFSENDLLLSLRLKWCRTDFFNLEFDGGFLFKFTSIDLMSSYKSSLNTPSYFLEVSMNWQFTPLFDFYCSVKSIDYFDYPLLGTPFFKVGCDYQFAENLKLNADLTLKFVDMITSAVYLSECIFRTGVKVYY